MEKNNLRKLREKLEYTQQQVADLLQVGLEEYQSYEEGETMIPMDKLELLAGFCGVYEWDIMQADGTLDAIDRTLCETGMEWLDDILSRPEKKAIDKVYMFNTVSRNYQDMVKMLFDNGLISEGHRNEYLHALKRLCDIEKETMKTHKL